MLTAPLSGLYLPHYPTIPRVLTGHEDACVFILKGVCQHHHFLLKYPWGSHITAPPPSCLSRPPLLFLRFLGYNRPGSDRQPLPFWLLYLPLPSDVPVSQLSPSPMQVSIQGTHLIGCPCRSLKCISLSPVSFAALWLCFLQGSKKSCFLFSQDPKPLVLMCH